MVKSIIKSLPEDVNIYIDILQRGFYFIQMIEVAEKDIQKAFITWYRHYNFKSYDAEVQSFLAPTLPAFKSGQIGWLEKARKSLFLSTLDVAKNMELSREAYSKLELRERLGSISLANLNRAAEAMDCELVYAIRPKSRISFSKIIWTKLVYAVIRHPSLRSYDKNQRDKSVAAIAIKLMNSPEFKKNQGWSQRANQET